MKSLITSIMIAIMPFFLIAIPILHVQAAPIDTTNAKQCSRSFFGFPTWYEFLPMTAPPNCEIQMTENVINANGQVNQQVTFENVWLIALAVIEILMTMAGVVAVVFVIVGGFKYVTSTGDPNAVAVAKNTVIGALIGLVIAILASQIVAYIANKLGGQ